MPRTPSQFFRTASPEALFVISGISQYTGASIAVHLFEELPPATVAVFRVLLGALPILLISWRDQRSWSRADLKAAAIFGLATAAMNLCFYLGINRLPLGKSVVMEFIGPVAVAAWFTRSRRNTLALVLAATGVAVLSGVELGGDPLGVLFILMASAFWATYIVLGRRVASLDRGLSGVLVDAACGQLARQLLARVFATHEQPERAEAGDGPAPQGPPGDAPLATGYRRGRWGGRGGSPRRPSASRRWT